jgi:hypothetical protein
MAKGIVNPDWLEELARLTEVKADIEELTVRAIKGARRNGISWYKIGPAMGVSRQAVAEKYAKLVK